MSVTKAAIELLKVLNSVSTSTTVQMVGGTYRCVHQRDADRVAAACDELREALGRDYRALQEIA